MSRKLKIGMILDHTFPPDTRVENEAVSLVEAGHEVVILCFNKKGSSDLVEKYRGITLQKFNTNIFFVKKFRALTNTILNLYPYYWAHYIKKLIKKYDIDVLHVHDLYMLSSAFKANKKYNLPVVADLHENYAEGLKNYKFANSFWGKVFISIPKWEKTEVDWCHKADHVITVIEEGKERYNALGIPKDKINVVANYVDCDEFLNEEDDLNVINGFKDKFVVSYIGGFDRHRGLESVIKAIPEIVKTIKNLCVVLVGSGSNQNELGKIAKDLRIESHLSFEGFQPHKKLPSYIKASDVCLIPHLKTLHTDNTIPHKLFHYMLLEKPIVASNCNPVKRIIEEAKSGLIYESENSQQIAEAIVKLFKNDKQRSDMGKAGILAVSGIYNWKMAAQNLNKLYDSI